ncbi:aldose 1-epimerase [Microbacterium sp. E-13]|uniref:aldose 1-epimerase n=1 Tax=Microbacterium sp. E-13 TaxID=3404048 RepID=UPI003CFA698F
MSTATIDMRMRLATEAGLTAFVVESDDGAVVARISPVGATLLSWRASDGSASYDLVDGYQDAAELTEQAGVRNAVMAPFTNRVRDARYGFDGEEHDLTASATGSPPLLLHGMFRTRRFAPVESIATADSFMLRLRNQQLVEPVADPMPGYPFAVGLDVVYVLRRDSIAMDIIATNHGESAAPVTLGWHPYFTLGAPVDQLVLHVDAAARVATDDALIPLDGDAGIVELSDGDALDFRHPRQVGSAVIDTCFTGLATASDGLHHTFIQNPATGVGLDVWQERGSMHVYTADHLERGPRASIALEPVEALTNAFNRRDQADLVRLQPGQARAFRFGARLITT